MKKLVLPTVDELLFAISETPLGEGKEAKVFKVHMRPNFTIRINKDITDYEALSKRIFNQGFLLQPDVFEGRNFAQSVAYLASDDPHSAQIDATINLYAPGFSMEIDKSGRELPTSDEALMKTIALTKAVLNMPDSAFDKLYDDLHFLSSKKYSIDVGNGGLFVNMGNILYSGVDKKFSIIDVQPFLKDHPGINMQHTKGFNTPLYLTRGLITGMEQYADEHSKYPLLIQIRTEIVNKIISAAERNHLNDVNGYLKGDIDQIMPIWKIQLSKMNIDEKYQQDFIQRLKNIKDENPYPVIKENPTILRVSGRSPYS